jgi:hypothetical protein
MRRSRPSGCRGGRAGVVAAALLALAALLARAARAPAQSSARLRPARRSWTGDSASNTARRGSTS